MEANSELNRLNDELNKLGGGESRTASLEQHCIVDEWKGKADTQTLWPLRTSLGVRKPAFSEKYYESDGISYYPTSSTSNLLNVIETPEKFQPIRQISRWLLDGYNACLTTYGARDTCKSRILFGDANSAPESFDSPQSCSLVHTLLRDLYRAQEAELEEGRFNLSIGISAWTLTGANKIVDLCHASAGAGGDAQYFAANALRFTTVLCPTIETALKTVSSARATCPGVLAKPNRFGSVMEADRAHFFLRVIIHRASAGVTSDIGRVSHLHVADLIGTAPTEGPAFSSLHEDDQAMRREFSTQLGSFTRMILDLGGQTWQQRPTRLTQILAPVVTGNAKTWVLAFLKNGENNVAASMSTMNALEGSTTLSTTCHRIEGVPLSQLDMHPAPPTHSSDGIEKCNWSPVSATKDTGPHLAREEREFLVSFLESDVLQEINGMGGARDASGLRRAEFGREAVPATRDAWTNDLANDEKDSGYLSVHFGRAGHLSSREDRSTDYGRNTDVPRALPPLPAHQSIDPEHEGTAAAYSRHNNHVEELSKSYIGGVLSSPPPSPPRDVSTASDMPPDRSRLDLDRSTSGPSSGPQPIHLRGGSVSRSASSHFAAQYDGGIEEGELRDGQEAALSSALRRSHSSLLRALDEERKKRAAYEERVAALEEEVQECRAEAIVKEASTKVEELRLRGVIRQMANDKGLGAALECFERHIQRLESENSSLRQRNVLLEDRSLVGVSGELNASELKQLRVRETHRSEYGQSFGSINADDIENTPLDNTNNTADDLESHFGQVHYKLLTQSLTKAAEELRVRLKRAEREAESARLECQALQQKERQFMVSVRLATTTTRKLKSCQAEAVRLSELLEEERRSRGGAAQDLAGLQEELLDVQASESRMRADYNAVVEECHRLRARVRELERDKQEQHKVDRFVAKHVGTTYGSVPPVLSPPRTRVPEPVAGRVRRPESADRGRSRSAERSRDRGADRGSNIFAQTIRDATPRSRALPERRSKSPVADRRMRDGPSTLQLPTEASISQFNRRFPESSFSFQYPALSRLTSSASKPSRPLTPGRAPVPDLASPAPWLANAAGRQSNEASFYGPSLQHAKSSLYASLAAQVPTPKPAEFGTEQLTGRPDLSASTPNKARRH